MAKLYIPEGVWLACDKGTSPSTLRVSNNKNTTIYSQPMATEADKIPFFNIKPMGVCIMKGGMCMPTIFKWDNAKDGVKINGNKMLLETSTCDCLFKGKITIHFDKESAVGYGMGEGKMPSEYIKDGFDWSFNKMDEAREARDSWLPDWMEPVAHAKDWFDDLNVGLVEGAVNGIVGLGETVYQVAQDPVGTWEGLSGMASDAWDATTKGVSDGLDWASKGENWSNAAEGAWDWASDGENWVDAGNAAIDKAKDAGQWVADNPRQIGGTVGEFIPDAVAAVYTGGASIAASAGRRVLREGVEEVVEEGVERAAREAVEEIAEEGAEALGKKTAKEIVESLGDDAADIAKVTTRNLLDTIKLSNPFKRNPAHNADEFLRQLRGQQDGLNKLTIDDFIKNRDEYLKNGRSAKGTAAQRRYREQALQDRIDDNIANKSMNPRQAKEEAKNWIKDKAALHDPDQVAGGFGDNITGMGDSRVNSSLGSQWKTRIDEIDDQVRKAAENMTEAEMKSTYLNVDLIP